MYVFIQESLTAPPAGRGDGSGSFFLRNKFNFNHYHMTFDECGHKCGQCGAQSKDSKVFFY